MDLLFDGHAAAPLTVLLAHGAGAGMESPFLADVATGLATAGLRVARFEFPYMAARRSGRRPGPDRLPVLLEHFRAVRASLPPDTRVALAGKSMGGRIATMVADELGARAVVVFGYPFHPPGRPQQLRTAHLATLRTPCLILQGERDPFGTRAEFGAVSPGPAVTIGWLADGDHGLVPRARSGRTATQNLQQAIAEASAFLAAATGDPA